MSRAFPDDLRRAGLEPDQLLDAARARLPEIHGHARTFLRALLAA
jgi:hypothetical protein